MQRWQYPVLEGMSSLPVIPGSVLWFNIISEDTLVLELQPNELSKQSQLLIWVIVLHRVVDPNA
jgi:hypothetical protein